MSKNYDEQSHQSLFLLKLTTGLNPTPNRTYFELFLENDDEKAIIDIEKFVDIIEMKNVKEKEPEDA